MDTNNMIDEELEVLDFDDDEETVSTQDEPVQESPMMADPMPEIEPVMPDVFAPEVEVPSFSQYTMFDNEPTIPEETISESETPSFDADPMPEIVPVMPDAFVPEVEVPSFEGFESAVSNSTVDSYNSVENSFDDAIVNTANLNYSAFDVEDQNEPVMSTTTMMPPIEPKEIVKTEEEKKILKDLEATMPTDLNDQLLKLEDTLSKNNLKEDIQKNESKDEASSNKNAIIFISVIFVLLALLIVFLPTLVKLL